MANTLRGEVDVTVGKKTYTLWLDMGYAIAMERARGIKSVKLFQQFGDGDYGADEINAILYYAAQSAELGVTERDVLGWVTELGLAAASKICGVLLYSIVAPRASLNDKAEGKKRPRPMKAPTSENGAAAET